MSTERLEAQIRDCYRSWSTTYFDGYYASEHAYPPVHVDIVRNELAALGARRVLDAGCGPASMLRLLDPGMDRHGFDLTPEMIEEARRVLGTQGVPEERLWVGSVLDRAAFREAGSFDAALCFGVLPHVPERFDAEVFANLRDAVRPGGLVLVEARNRLFGLFTMNRPSRALFAEDLMDEAALRAAAEPEELAGLDAALAELDGRFRLDLPPLRQNTDGTAGYDEVLSRTHVPMELMAQAAAVGLGDARVLFYHYHAVPPMLERHVPALARRRSLALENPTDWRGHFMASAFILAARRV